MVEGRSVSCLTDLHLVQASECTLLEAWPAVCCRVRKETTRCRH